MKRSLLLLAIVICTFSCTSNSGSKQPVSDTLDVGDNTPRLDIVSSEDVYVASDNCVVFIMPSDEEIESMQKELPEDVYGEVISDIVWYPGIAAEVLDSFNIHNAWVTNQSQLKFILKNGELIEYEKNELEGNMILFRNDTIPYIGSAIVFDREFVLEFFQLPTTPNN